MKEFKTVSYGEYFARLGIIFGCAAYLAPKAVTAGTMFTVFLFIFIMLIINHNLVIGSAHVTKLTKKGFLNIPLLDLFEKELSDIDRKFAYQRLQIKMCVKYILKTSTHAQWNDFVNDFERAKVSIKDDLINEEYENIDKIKSLIGVFENLNAREDVKDSMSEALSMAKNLKGVWSNKIEPYIADVVNTCDTLNLSSASGDYTVSNCNLVQLCDSMEELSSFLEKGSIFSLEVEKLKELSDKIAKDIDLFLSNDKNSKLYKKYVDCLVMYVENKCNASAKIIWRF